ncbi:hypothetical protein [Desulfosporosinus fructosivorans]
MIEHIGLIVAIAFMLTRLTTFRNLIDHKLDPWTILQLSIVFGLFGIKKDKRYEVVLEGLLKWKTLRVY